jgi:hypothetical protein
LVNFYRYKCFYDLMIQYFVADYSADYVMVTNYSTCKHNNCFLFGIIEWVGYFNDNHFALLERFLICFIFHFFPLIIWFKNNR